MLSDDLCSPASRSAEEFNILPALAVTAANVFCADPENLISISFSLPAGVSAQPNSTLYANPFEAVCHWNKCEDDPLT